MAIRHFSAAVAMLALVAFGAGDRAAGQAAPSPEALQAAHELTTVMSVGTMSEFTTKMSDQVWPSLEAAIRRQYANIEVTRLLNLRREFERLQLVTAIEAMKDAAPIYARHLSVDEMRAIAAFYRTPAGAKALAVMPQISLELMTVMVPRMKALQQKTMAAFGEALRAKGSDAK